MIADPRGPIDYDETGEGPTVVLVPGSCSTGAAWRPIIAHLHNGFRCVTTSLLGYGGTAERRSRDDATIAAKKAQKVGSKAADAAGALAREVAKNDMAKDAAAGAAIGALIAMPLPIIGPPVGAAVGAMVGVAKNLRSARNPGTKPEGKRKRKS